MYAHTRVCTDESEVKKTVMSLYCHPKTELEPVELLSQSLKQEAWKLNPFDFCRALLA